MERRCPKFIEAMPWVLCFGFGTEVARVSNGRRQVIPPPLLSCSPQGRPRRNGASWRSDASSPQQTSSAREPPSGPSIWPQDRSAKVHEIRSGNEHGNDRSRFTSTATLNFPNPKIMLDPAASFPHVACVASNILVRNRKPNNPNPDGELSPDTAKSTQHIPHRRITNQETPSAPNGRAADASRPAGDRIIVHFPERLWYPTKSTPSPGLP